MVLTQSEVDTEAPGISFDTEGSGYQDNEAAADGTFDPEDSAADIADQGRLDGYSHNFFDFGVLLGGEESEGKVYNVGISVDLFDGPETATSSIQRQISDFRRLQGTVIQEGITLDAFVELPAPNVGSETVAGHLNISIDVPGLAPKTTVTFVSWRRDNVVGVVTVAVVGEEGKVAAAERLAGLMDRRIDGVLAGEIVATPVAPEPGRPLEGDAEERALAEGFDISAMLHTVADLPKGVALQVEGYIEESDGISAYFREFGPEEGEFMELES